MQGEPFVVTGAAGFLGSHVVRRLVQEGARVTALVRESSDLWRIEEVLSRIHILHWSMESPEPPQVEASLPEGATIFHLAAAGVRERSDDPVRMMAANVIGTHRLLEIARRIKAACFVYSGSCFEYGSGERVREEQWPTPVSEYGASKAAAWVLVNQFFRRYKMPVVSLRPFTIFGPSEGGGRLIPGVMTAVLRGHSVDLTAGEQTRDFVYVEDVVEAFVRAGREPRAVGHTINVCTGRAWSVRDVVAFIEKVAGRSVDARFGVCPYRSTEAWTLSGDPSRARELLGWSPSTDFQEGLARTVRWFQEKGLQYPEYARP